MGRGNFEGKGAAHCKVRGHYCAVICAKTAELIEMPFGLRVWMGPWNHVLDGSSDPPWKGAILTGRACVDMPDDTLM